MQTDTDRLIRVYRIAKEASRQVRSLLGASRMEGEALAIAIFSLDEIVETVENEIGGKK